MLYGPGTNGGSIVFKLERQAEWIVRVIRRIRRWNVTAVEVRSSSYQRFNRWLDKNNAKMTWQGGCHHYFAAPTGRIVTQWPASMSLYWLMTRTLNRAVTVSRRVSTQTSGPDE